MKQTIIDRLEKAGNLPVMPAIAVQVLAVIDQPSTSLSDIAEIINKDPALTLRLLQLANSAFYGRSRSIADVQSALSLIGLRQVVPLVLALSLKTTIRGQPGKVSRVNLEDFWRRAVLTSCLSSKLADYTGGVSAEEALLAGLLQDIGILVCESVCTDIYPEGLDLLSGGHMRICDFEVQAIGTDHSELGAWLLERWNFPMSVVSAVSDSHNTPLSKEQSLRWCVAGASCIADSLMAGLADGSLHDHVQSALHFYWLGLAKKQIPDLSDQILEMIGITEALFDVDVIGSIEASIPFSDSFTPVQITQTVT